MVDIFLFDLEAAAAQAAGWAMTCCIFAWVAVSEGSFSCLHPDDINLDGKLSQ
jgi:hypothetical protein